MLFALLSFIRWAKEGCAVLFVRLSTVPTWMYGADIKPIATAQLGSEAASFEVEKWKGFIIEELFSVIRGRYSNVAESENGCIPLVTAYTQNNGISKYISCYDKYIAEGNCLTVANTGQGSVFRTFYQPNRFVPSNNVTCLYPKSFALNKYTGLFIATLCWLEIPRYSYGRIVNNKQLSDTQIKLPATSGGLPDWDYMEQYIKSLPYSDRI